MSRAGPHQNGGPHKRAVIACDRDRFVQADRQLNREVSVRSGIRSRALICGPAITEYGFSIPIHGADLGICVRSSK